MTTAGSIGIELFLDIKPFKEQFSQLESLVSSFFDGGKLQADEFSKALGGLKFPEIDISSLKVDMSPFVSQMKEAKASLEGLMSAIRSFDAGIAPLRNIFNMLNTNPKQIKTNFKNAKSAISELIKKFDLAKIKTKALSAAKGILNGVKAVFNALAKANPIGLIITAIGVLVAAIVALVQNWDDVKEAVQNFVRKAAEFLGRLWEGIKEIAGNIGRVFSDVWNWVVDGVSGMVNGVRERFNNLWEGIRAVAGAIAEVFGNAWQGVTDGVAAVRDVVVGIFSAVVETIRGFVNRIIGFVNGMISAVAGGINAVIGALNRINFDVPDWVPVVGGRSFGLNIPKVQAPQIPMLARGGIVDAPTLALVGERGREAVLPLENNTGWMADLANTLAEAMAANGAFGGRGGEARVNLYIDGRKLAEGLIDDLDQAAERRDMAVAWV